MSMLSSLLFPGMVTIWIDLGKINFEMGVAYVYATLLDPLLKSPFLLIPWSMVLGKVVPSSLAVV